VGESVLIQYDKISGTDDTILRQYIAKILHKEWDPRGTSPNLNNTQWYW
jgi:hypothetical protein